MTIKIILFGYLTLSTLLVCRASDLGFGFPEPAEEHISKQNANKKKPVYIPNHCRQDELLYPGDQSDDWVCDCKPGTIYYPPANLCFAAYRKGPCNPYQYLVLLKDSAIPVCKSNPCQRDGFVRFRNGCYELNRPGPCSLPELSYAVGINTTSLEVDCISDSTFSIGDRFGSDEASTSRPKVDGIQIPPGFTIDEIGKKECYIGSKRSFENKCPEENDAKGKN